MDHKTDTDKILALFDDAVECGIGMHLGSGSDDLAAQTRIRKCREELVASLAASAGSEPVATARSLAQLRHLYHNMISGGVRDAGEAKTIAAGVLGPVIVALETGDHPSPPEGMVGGWRLIAEAPKDGSTLLLGRYNERGQWRTMRGAWISAFDDECWDVPDDANAGWYETTVEDDEGKCWRIEPTHYMQLPPAPSVAGGGGLPPPPLSEEGASHGGAG